MDRIDKSKDAIQQELSQLKAGKAADPDGIAPDLNKHLSTKGTSVLLTIINSSRLSSWCQQSWRSAYMVPFHKKEKDPADAGNYRPIALTSMIVKVLERLITNRLSCWLEEHSTLSLWQAGFRKGHSTTDQGLWPSQFISDGVQSTQRQRTIATLFDISGAYDHVWRTGLLMKMSKIGIPRRFTEWLSSWFINRTARV